MVWRLLHANAAVTLGVYSHLFERRAGERLGDRLAAFVREQAAAAS